MDKENVDGKDMELIRELVAYLKHRVVKISDAVRRREILDQVALEARIDYQNLVAQKGPWPQKCRDCVLSRN